jgi:hypothetical protein
MEIRNSPGVISVEGDRKGFSVSVGHRDAGPLADGKRIPSWGEILHLPHLSPKTGAKR